MNSAKLRNFYFGLLQTRVGLILSYLFRSGYFVRLSCVQFGRKFIAIWKSREFSNFTYFLRDESYEYLPYFVSNIVGCTAADAERVIKELELDQELALYCSLETERSKRRLSADPTFKPGRLLLHYAIVRLTKPRLVFEAGLDKGFGAIILNRALQKNKDEGFQSDYIGVEYRVDRPAFLIENYPNPVGRIVYASWSEVFEGLSAGTVDFFFYDAVTSDEEIQKFKLFSDRMSDDAISICAWSFKSLYVIEEQMGRCVSVFPALAKDHWFDGSDLCVIHKQNRDPLQFQ